ncbi:MAG: hypothetical protein RR313_01065 [Anaerovoracaceae bacterium]
MTPTFYNLILITLIPFLTKDICRENRNLVWGIIISFAYLTQNSILATSIIGGVCLCIFIYTKIATEKANSTTDINHNCHNVFFKTMIINPSFVMLLIFIVSITAFFSFSSSSLTSSYYATNQILTYSSAVIGPIFVGRFCDTKGAYNGSICFTLMAEVALFVIIKEYPSVFMDYAASILYGVATTSIFVLLPALVMLFFGNASFSKAYVGITAFFLLWNWGFTKAFNFLSKDYESYGGILILVIISLVAAALFILLAWKRRLVIIKNPQKTAS